MKRVYFGNVQLDTQDDVADLVVGYAMLLAKFGESDVVGVPAYIDGDPNETTAVLLLTPSSQIATAPQFPALPDPSGSLEAVTELKNESELLLQRHSPA